MAYRAPELFDVKTGVTLDEKVDIWVRHVLLLVLGADVHTSLSVTRVYTIRACLPSLSLRESPNDAAGRLDSHGSHERSIQAPPERLFARLQKLDRCDIEGEPRGPTQYPSTHRDDGACPPIIIVTKNPRWS